MGWACKVCNLRLNVMEGSDGSVRYLHAGSRDLLAAGRWRVDHKPEPVMRPTESATLLCDFCSVEGPAWRVPLTKDVEYAPGIVSGTGLVADFVDEDRVWAACDACADLVARGKRRLLLERTALQFRDLTGVVPETAVIESLGRRQDEFWDGVPGRPVRMTPQPGKEALHPREVPRLRDDLVRYYRRYGSSNGIAAWMEAASLYLVRARQVEYVSAMALSLPDHRGLLGYAPCDTGLMFLDVARRRPQVTVEGYEQPVRAYAWRRAGAGFEVNAWTFTSGVPAHLLNLPEAARLTPLLHGAFTEEEGRAEALLRRGGMAVDARMFYPLLTLWYRMQEPRYSSASVDRPQPKDRRKAARNGSPGNLDVTVIDVRHPRTQSGAQSGGGRAAGWVMDYREEVDGHSKLVHYGPGRSQVRRVWVDPYERGPKDAPFKAPRPPVVGVVK
jgi:hypothetical protein